LRTIGTQLIPVVLNPKSQWGAGVFPVPPCNIRGKGTSTIENNCSTILHK